MGEIYNIDPQKFWDNPYPDLTEIQAQAPAVEVPQLGAVLITRRNDVFEQEKRTEVFSSYQPEGLMSVLMGENMMRKDGEAHQKERKIIFPALSPRTVRDHWVSQFRTATKSILNNLAPKEEADLVRDFAMPVCGEALKAITGLRSMKADEMDRVSQHMLDGCANYIGDAEVEARCHEATKLIDEHIDIACKRLAKEPDLSALSVQLGTELSMDSVRANVKLVISGGQNEPRDAIAGTAWALMAHPEQFEQIKNGDVSYLAAFEEYAKMELADWYVAPPCRSLRECSGV